MDVGILDADDHVELLDGVLVEMNPQGMPTEVRAFGEDETVTVVELGLAVPVSSL